MPTKFICLANSIKEGGRCMAGIELDGNNNPIFVNNRPKWVRPVCNTPHGEVPNSLAEPFNILDIIELEVTGYRANGYQSENIDFNENSMRLSGNFNIDNLVPLCDNRSLIFANRGKAVSIEQITQLDHSLVLISVTEFEVERKIYPDKPGKPQLRLVFKYNDNEYDLPITDSSFRVGFDRNPDLLHGINQVYLCLSLGIEWENWYYKLVAGIIYAH